jgi:hypothetical protein
VSEQGSQADQDPHQPINTRSKPYRGDEDDEVKIKPDRTVIPPPPKTTSNPNRHVQRSKRECSAAPEVARLQAEILRIPLSNGRTFQCNGKLNAIIAEELMKGRSAANPPGSQVCRQNIARPRSDAGFDTRRQLGGNNHRNGVVAGGGGRRARTKSPRGEG